MTASDFDIWERLKKLAEGNDYSLLKGTIVGLSVTATISGLKGIPFDRACELEPGQTVRYWLCIGDGRAWYEWELIPAIGTGPKGLG